MPMSASVTTRVTQVSLLMRRKISEGEAAEAAASFGKALEGLARAMPGSRTVTNRTERSSFN